MVLLTGPAGSGKTALAVGSRPVVPASPTRRPAPLTSPPGTDPTRATTIAGFSPTKFPNRAVPWSWHAFCNWLTPTTPPSGGSTPPVPAQEPPNASASTTSPSASDTARWWHSQMDTATPALLRSTVNASTPPRTPPCWAPRTPRPAHHPPALRHRHPPHDLRAHRRRHRLPLREPDMELLLPGPLRTGRPSPSGSRPRTPLRLTRLPSTP